MKNKQDKLAIALTMVVTAIALVSISATSAIQEGSIQPQGQQLIELANEELTNIPQQSQEVASNLIESTEDRLSNFNEEIDEIVENSDSASDLVDESVGLIKEVLPDVPDVVKQSDGKLLELISIPPETGFPGCEDTNTCFLPVKSTIQAGGEVIWTNHDTVVHTVTSGNPNEVTSGLFDSGMIQPEGTYSLEFEIPFEYDYFCLVHPWMQGTIMVK